MLNEIAPVLQSKVIKDHDPKLLKNQMIMPIEAKLSRMLENENINLQITLLGENGVKADLNAKLKKTKSGHMAMDVKDVSHVGEIANKTCLVSLFTTSSGYKLGISKNNENCNAVLTTGSSGDMTVVLKEDIKFQENNTTSSKSQESLFRVRAKNTDAPNPDTTLIRATSRGNYEFILDKEFETRYKKVINDYLGENTYCYVNLSRTTSGTYIIDFGENHDVCENNLNALLEKSDSGSVMLTVCANPEAIEKQHPAIEESTKKFKDLYKRLSESEEFKKESLFKQKKSDTASGCALGFDEKIIITIRDREHLVAELGVSLKHISSGIYSVIFDTKSKGLFVANLLTSWNGWLPIQSVTKREVSVYLNRCMKPRNQYGWLKRSPDGQILVEVDQIASGVATYTYPNGCTGVHGEKAVTTTFHGNTDNCDCDKTKCICNELPLDWTDWYFHLSTHNVQIGKKQDIKLPL